MKQVFTLKKRHGIEVVWVTSGAIASAVERTSFSKRNRKLSEKQALSAIGQPLVMDLYNIALQTTGLLGAQILLTYSDLAHAGRRGNFKNTIEELLSWGVVPVLNENDAVATDEIKFGDNDSLSAKVAKVVGAERLIILTDVAGLFDADPSVNPNARLISRLNRVPQSLLKSLELSSRASKTHPTRGTGGMYSKIRAAAEATQSGSETWLVRGDLPSVLLDVAAGKNVGTVIESGKSARLK